MATVTQVFSIDYVAKLLDEDAELLQAIVSNDDNLSYSLTRDGIEELEQMLTHARRTAHEWNDLLEAFVDDDELIARIKAKSPR